MHPAAKRWRMSVCICCILASVERPTSAICFQYKHGHLPCNQTNSKLQDVIPTLPFMISLYLMAPGARTVVPLRILQYMLLLCEETINISTVG